MNFTCIPLFCVRGLGIGGLRQAPLNFTMNNSPPSHVPAEKPPGNCLLSDFSCLYNIVNDLSFSYEYIMANIHPGRCIAHKSSMTRLCDPRL